MTPEPIFADHPKPGWYKMRYDRNGKWLPVAIWMQDGELVARVGAERAEPSKIWTWCADKPVSKESAKFAFANGYWPDEPVPVSMSNLPADPFDALLIVIEQQRARAEEWLAKRPTILQQADANLAVNMQKELLRLNKEADALHKAEKAPALEKARAIDDKFRFRAEVADVADKLRKVFGKFMAEEEARQKAASAAKWKEEQARVAAEQARLQAEREAKLIHDPIAALTEDPPVMPQLPLGPEPVRVQAGGGVGRRAGLRDSWVGVIEDYPKTMAYFSAHPDVRALIDKLVKHEVRDTKGARPIPGVKINHERIPI